jgi:hypothetical protein
MALSSPLQTSSTVFALSASVRWIRAMTGEGIGNGTDAGGSYLKSVTTLIAVW